MEILSGWIHSLEISYHEPLCIRPEKQLEVGRMEKDITQLEQLCEEGFRQGKRFCEQYTP